MLNDTKLKNLKRAAKAYIRYNLGGERRISLFADELSNVINQPLTWPAKPGRRGTSTPARSARRSRRCLRLQR